MKNILCFFAFLHCLFSQNIAISQNFLSTSGTAIVNEVGDTVILRGMGLGGWMLQEGYMLQTSGFADAQYEIKEKISELVGTEVMEQFYENWLINYMQREDVDSLKSWGFNSVRLPMHYNLYTLPIEEEAVPGEDTWLERGFEITDSLISWCKKNEMYVILDLHAAPGGQGQESSISDYDPSKPSLWQSNENKRKTVALWKRLAERYKDEAWVAGYDLLNEPNWDLPNNAALRELYETITDSIRSVDQRHIIFIEGNWFANDFTGLTPPWDDQFVYSPHKYWSFNDPGSIQWVLDLRDQYNVPLYFGESGENSNTWFRDAIALFESEGIGWAWWPLKKVESISGPLSVNKSSDYQVLLDFWSNGGTEPTQEFATNALFGLAEDLKLANCRYQKDVIDAMFRQVSNEETVPFKQHSIPGIIYATDFDMGRDGLAYRDVDIANYHVSTGNFTAWNQGWSYRNDGVDIEPCQDEQPTNGFNVGWTASGEWMQYEVKVEESGVYDIEIRMALNEQNSSCHFEMNGADITKLISLSSTGDWQNWQTVTVPGVILDTQDNLLRFHVDNIGANLSFFNFVKRGETTDLSTVFVSANTLDESTIELHLNKPISNQSPVDDAEFDIRRNGSSVGVSGVVISEKSSRILEIQLSEELSSVDELHISYENGDIEAEDGTSLEAFTLEPIKNTIRFYHPIPGRIEAEDYHFQSGVQLENTTDEGGGQNIGFLDTGDYLDYYIDVPSTEGYKITFRTAAESATGGVQLQLIDDFGEVTTVLNMSFQPTGDWQSWRSSSQQINLPEGRYQLRMNITKSQFNINWFEISSLTSLKEQDRDTRMVISPNPSTGHFILHLGDMEKTIEKIEVYNSQLQKIKSFYPMAYSESRLAIDLSSEMSGLYFLSLINTSGEIHTEKVIIQK